MEAAFPCADEKKGLTNCTLYTQDRASRHYSTNIKGSIIPCLHLLQGADAKVRFQVLREQRYEADFELTLSLDILSTWRFLAASRAILARSFSFLKRKSHFSREKSFLRTSPLINYLQIAGFFAAQLVNQSLSPPRVSSSNPSVFQKSALLHSPNLRCKWVI